MEAQMLLGIAAGSLTAIAAIPQILTALKTKEVRHVSTFMFLILIAGNALWCWYGRLLKDWPIIVTNAFSLLMSVIMLVLKARYGNRRS